jgi:hypothetical protein
MTTKMMTIGMMRTMMTTTGMMTTKKTNESAKVEMVGRLDTI